MKKFDRPKKHSLTLKGHRKNIALNELASDIDSFIVTDIGLASAIRLYILEYIILKCSSKN